MQINSNIHINKKINLTIIVQCITEIDISGKKKYKVVGKVDQTQLV